MSLESSLLSSLARKLGDLLVDEVKLLKGVEDQVQSMQRELTWIGSYLRDVDEGQEESNQILRARIKEIRIITFQAENVIDLFILLEDTRRRKSFLKRYVFSFPNYLVQRREIKVINKRIQKNRKIFETYHVSGRNEQIQRRLPQGNPLNNDELVVGSKDDVRMLVRKLTTEHQENVLCIAGMSGSGKTTLAKELYNHETIKQHFRYHKWFSISQEWSVDRFLTEMLDKIPSFIWRAQELYLIVFDGLWEKNALERVLPVFSIGSKGSKIIITTRNSDVVQVPSLSYSLHEPRRLNAVESWDLLTKIVLNQWQVFNNCQLIGDFERLGNEMLKKCAGLPLAIIALGGILCSKNSIEEWETMSKNVSAKVMEGSGTQNCGIVKDVLALSYNELPYDLKPCFLYFALFPEDFVIPVEKLMRMWISEGFITNEQCREQETLEDAARQFLNELIQRYVVQVEKRNYKGKVKTVRIHNLIREFCIEKAKERNFLEFFPLQSSAAQTQIQGGTTTQSRRISLYSSSSDTCIPFQAQNSNVRSLFVFLLEWGQSFNFASVYKNFLFLKVLDIMIPRCSFNVFVLPTEIGNLIHLTYLRIKNPTNVIVPKSIVNLRSLITLDCHCNLLFEEGYEIWWEMYQVRHLLFKISVEPHAILKFAAYRSLQTLLGVRGSDGMLREMSTLSPTVKRLRIVSISTNEQLEAVFQCPSFKSGHLQTLSLHWTTPVKLRNIELSFCCHSLCELSLNGPIGEQDFSPLNLFPPNLEKVTLFFSELRSNEAMAALGKLPNLRYLYLHHDSYMGTDWTCSAGEFPQLERLEMYGLRNLKEWRVDEGAMPRLKFLRVGLGSALIRLPKLGNNVVVDHRIPAYLLN